MCWTTVPTYQRTNIPQLNSDVINQVQSNFNRSYSYEGSMLPDQSALRKGNNSVPANILNDLKLGGGLRADTQDSVMGSSLNQANSSGVINSFSGRGLVAKDIGQTAEGLRQTRLARAQDYIRSEPLQFQGLNSGELASVFTDDKVREFQNQKDKAQAQQADTATNIATGLGIANIIGSFL